MRVFLLTSASAFALCTATPALSAAQTCYNLGALTCPDETTGDREQGTGHFNDLDFDPPEQPGDDDDGDDDDDNDDHCKKDHQPY